LTISPAISAAQITIDTSSGAGGITLNAALGSVTATSSVSVSSAGGAITGIGTINSNANSSGVTVLSTSGAIGSATAPLKVNSAVASISSTSGLLNATDAATGVTTVGKLGTSGALTFASSGPASFNSNITGSSVTLKITGANTFSGDVTSASGALSVNQSGTGTLLFVGELSSGGALSVTQSGTGTLSFSGNLSAAGALTVTQAGNPGSATFEGLSGTSVNLTLKPTIGSPDLFGGNIAATTGAIILTESNTGTTAFQGTAQQITAGTIIKMNTVGTTSFNQSAKISAANDSISITETTGQLTIGSNDILSASGNTAGSITLLENANASGSGITIEQGASLSTSLSGVKAGSSFPFPGQISIAIGASVPTAPTNADPTDRPAGMSAPTLINTGAKNNVYWGANPASIVASGTNSTSVKGNTAVVFNAGNVAQIILGGGTSISADPPALGSLSVNTMPNNLGVANSSIANSNSSQPASAVHFNPITQVGGDFASATSSGTGAFASPNSTGASGGGYGSSVGSLSSLNSFSNEVLDGNSGGTLAGSASLNLAALAVSTGGTMSNAYLAGNTLGSGSALSAMQSLQNDANNLTGSGSANGLGALFSSANNSVPTHSLYYGQVSNELELIDAAISTGTGRLGNVRPHGESAFGSDSKEQVTLKEGNLVFAPSVASSVQTPFGRVDIGANSVVFIMVTRDALSVYNLDDEHKNAVSIHAGSGEIQLFPSRHATITHDDVRSFELINQAEPILHRTVSDTNLGGGLKVFTSEFFVPSAIRAIKPLRQMMSSTQPEMLRIKRHLLKTTAVVLQVRSSGEQYLPMLHPRITAFARQ